MTWNELKAALDEKLQEQGISLDVDVWYIDLTFPNSPEDFTVSVDDSGLNIYN